jgi:hypothetical protein
MKFDLSPRAIFGAPHVLNATVFLLADHRGFVTKAWRTQSILSGVINVGIRFGGFLFATVDVL